MSKYAYTGQVPGVLADGRPLAPGQRDVQLNAEQSDHPDNQVLIAEGTLVEIPSAYSSKTKVASK